MRWRGGVKLAESDFVEECVLEQRIISNGIAIGRIVTTKQEFSKVNSQMQGLLVVIDELDHLVVNPDGIYLNEVGDIVVLFPHSEVHSEFKVGVLAFFGLLAVSSGIVSLDLFGESGSPAPRRTAKTILDCTSNDAPEILCVFGGDFFLIEVQVMLAVLNDDAVGVGFGGGFHNDYCFTWWVGGVSNVQRIALAKDCLDLSLEFGDFLDAGVNLL